MNYKWLNQKNNDKLIIFFNGWGMDECAVKHLDPEDFDAIMFYDYSNLKLNAEKEINRYKSKYLIAWSMGVMTASLFDFGYISKTAVNGTLKPINNEFGIPEKIYDLTIKHLNIQKFIQSMYLEGEEIPNISRSFEEQKNELIALKTYRANEDFKYDKVIISTDDKIIPTKNQVKFWNIEPNLKSGHAPFYHFQKWSELL